MILSVLWTLICLIGLAVWLANVIDSLYYWRRLKLSEPELGTTYTREVGIDITVLSLMGFWTMVGALALLVPGQHFLTQLVIISGLFSGPVLLTLYGLWKFWKRRAR